VLDRHCAELGRDPLAIRRTVGVPPVCIRATREAAVAALAAIFERNGSSSAEALGWATSSPLADTRDAVVRLFRAWHAAGAEEAIIDQPSPLDDETIELLAGPVRERLG
jgi:alkanesulfonate monooxygenase SsuD/methylene tetrahydromethanopterin reductase-like flavin-dependent oxidoreductase (luciferase family)